MIRCGREALGILRWLMRAAPTQWRIILLADHREWLETSRRIELSITAAALISEITLFTLELVPYLELLDEWG